jgi:hypothetical protein
MLQFQLSLMPTSLHTQVHKTVAQPALLKPDRGTPQGWFQTLLAEEGCPSVAWGREWVSVVALGLGQ